MRADAGFTAVFVLLDLAGVVGCRPAPDSPAMTVTASAVRSERRLFDGAPPVIPHPPLNIKCVECHTDTGRESPPLGVAPANPHAMTTGLSGVGDCRQCHVFLRDRELFTASDFVGLPQDLGKAARLLPGAPPVIPHRVFMHENCNSCHSGPAARPEIRCSHPQRTNCRQCHVPVG